MPKLNKHQSRLSTSGLLHWPELLAPVYDIQRKSWKPSVTGPYGKARGENLRKKEEEEKKKKKKGGGGGGVEKKEKSLWLFGDKRLVVTAVSLTAC